MNEIDPIPSQNKPASEVETAWKKSAIQKTHSYVGLIVVLGLAYGLLSQTTDPFFMDGSFPSPRSLILNKSYHHKTVLSNLVLMGYKSDSLEVAYGGEHFNNCEDAKRTISPEGLDLLSKVLSSNTERLPPVDGKASVQMYLDACSLYELQTSGGLERAQKLDPMYWDYEKQFRELKNEAQIRQGLTKKQQPVPTAEMKSVAKKLEKIGNQVVIDAAQHLEGANNIAHVVVVFLIGLGIWCRRGLGRAILAPFGWMLSGAKKVHETV